MAINWARGLDELGTGLLRQADIGGRAYEGAMAKEAEMRAANRALRAEERANREWARREGITSGTAETVAEKLLTGQKDVAQMRIDALSGAAEKIATARESEFTRTRTWQVEDAKKLAGSKAEQDKIDRKVKRAESAEKALAELYEGLKDAEVVWDEKTQSYTSGSDYMDQIHAAQKRVSAAWRATGIKSLAAERNINATKWGYLEHSIFGAISLDLKENKPDIWKGIVEGLQSEKSSSDYKESVKTITPYLNDALRASSMRITASEKDSIREALIERLARFEEDAGDGAVTTRTSTTDTGTPSGFFEAQRVIDSLSGLEGEELSNYLRLGALAEAEAMESTKGGRLNPKQQAINAAKRRDPHNLLSILKGIRGKGAYDKTIVENLINKLEMWLENAEQVSAPPDPVRGYPSLAMAQPAGIVNPRGGMISAAGLSPAELARWEPEAVEARMA